MERVEHISTSRYVPHHVTLPTSTQAGSIDGYDLPSISASEPPVLPVEAQSSTSLSAACGPLILSPLPRSQASIKCTKPKGTRTSRNYGKRSEPTPGVSRLALQKYQHQGPGSKHEPSRIGKRSRHVTSKVKQACFRCKHMELQVRAGVEPFIPCCLLTSKLVRSDKWWPLRSMSACCHEDIRASTPATQIYMQCTDGII